MRKIFPVIIGGILGVGFGEYQIWKVGLFSRIPWLVAIPPIAFLVVVIVVWKCSKRKNA
jgi:ABC-type nitrate/sulfonate/bicarbonate transport system permease component